MKKMIETVHINKDLQHQVSAEGLYSDLLELSSELDSSTTSYSEFVLGMIVTALTDFRAVECRLMGGVTGTLCRFLPLMA